MLVAGIGPEAAALCTTYITQCAELVKDFIYLGTSGWSAQQGGILNAPSSCGAANGPTMRNSERLSRHPCVNVPCHFCAAAHQITPCATHAPVQAPLSPCAAANEPTRWNIERLYRLACLLAGPVPCCWVTSCSKKRLHISGTNERASLQLACAGSR